VALSRGDFGGRTVKRRTGSSSRGRSSDRGAHSRTTTAVHRRRSRRRSQALSPSRGLLGGIVATGEPSSWSVPSREAEHHARQEPRGHHERRARRDEAEHCTVSREDCRDEDEHRSDVEDGDDSGRRPRHLRSRPAAVGAAPHPALSRRHRHGHRLPAATAVPDAVGDGIAECIRRRRIDGHEDLLARGSKPSIQPRSVLASLATIHRHSITRYRQTIRGPDGRAYGAAGGVAHPADVCSRGAAETLRRASPPYWTPG
jgi:hypothetical protein